MTYLWFVCVIIQLTFLVVVGHIALTFVSSIHVLVYVFKWTYTPVVSFNMLNGQRLSNYNYRFVSDDGNVLVFISVFDMHFESYLVFVALHIVRYFFFFFLNNFFKILILQSTSICRYENI